MPKVLIGPDMNPSGICQCGCGQTTTVFKRSSQSHGQFVGNHARFISSHHLRIGPDYIVDPETGCWIWQRYVHPKWGYGQTSRKVGGKTIIVVAHKALYEKHIGPVPPGLQLDHTVCQRPNCVNPWHLEPVTPAVNTRRSRVAKLTETQVMEIRKLFEAGTTRKQLSTMFAVGYGEIKHIIRRTVWKGI